MADNFLGDMITEIRQNYTGYPGTNIVNNSQIAALIKTRLRDLTLDNPLGATTDVIAVTGNKYIELPINFYGARFIDLYNVKNNRKINTDSWQSVSDIVLDIIRNNNYYYHENSRFDKNGNVLAYRHNDSNLPVIPHCVELQTNSTGKAVIANLNAIAAGYTFYSFSYLAFYEITTDKITVNEAMRNSVMFHVIADLIMQDYRSSRRKDSTLRDDAADYRIRANKGFRINIGAS